MDYEEPQPGELGKSAQHREKLKHRVLKPGDSFGNFRVVRCFCAGLIVNYYHMQRVRDLRDVTVGVFHERTRQDTKFLKRLKSLQKVIEGCEHEGIPKILDCVEIDERFCLLLEPVEGQTLSQYFNPQARSDSVGLGPEKTTRIMAELLGVLGYVHSHGLDHRDIDSDMVLVQENGSIRLLGIGVKAALGNELFEAIVSASVSPLAANKTLGRLNSFDVMSPEYKAGIPEDSRVDLYCVGTIGYWLLTKQKPDPTNLQKPTSLVEGFSPQWDQFLGRLLERQQEQRFQSCRVALVALKEVYKQPESANHSLILRQIDRIPVPKRILDHGELAARIYRLSLIGVVGVTLTALTAFFLKVSFTEEATYRREVAQLVAEGQVPHLVVLVQPPVARIEFPGSGKSFITNNGRVELRVIPGEYRVRASALGHMDAIERVAIPAGAQESPQKLYFDLSSAWSDIQIRTESTAEISAIDATGEELKLGWADDEGNFSPEQGLLPGVYTVVISKEGYAPTVLQDQEIRSGEVFTIDAPLTPLPASLEVRTTPAGASIFVNDEKVGLSPLLLEELVASEQYLVEARLENHRPMGQQIELEPGQDRLLDLGELTPKSAALHLEASFEGLTTEQAKPLLEETSIVLGDRIYTYGSPELKHIPEGVYTIRLEHPRYVAPSREITLVDRDVQQLQVTLAPRPGRVRLLLPEGLKPSVRLNQNEILLQDNEITLPAYEVAELELRIKDYLTMVRNFELNPTEEVIWEVDPVPIPGPKMEEDWTVPYFGMRFAWIPPGSFSMGSPMREPGRLPNESEQTEVTLTYGFWAGIFEVTQAAYRSLMGEMPAEFVGTGHPVEMVTWHQAQAFCRKLTEQERAAGRLPDGYEYRLPTEAEWEYAARGGSTTPFHFGETANTSYGNFRGVYPRELDEGRRVAETYGTEPVGCYSPNAFGLYDVHGNVSEWTLDAYSARLPGGRLTDPEPRQGGERYTLRGGSWEDFAVRVRSAVRADARAGAASNTIGFRVFLAPEK